MGLDNVGFIEAQYEVLGMKQKEISVPQGTIEIFGFWSPTRLGDCQHPSIVPSGTDISLKTLTQHFVLGFYEADVVKPHRKKGLFECF